MKKNYKTKVFCRLSVIRVIFCSIFLLTLNSLWTNPSVYGQANVKKISLKLERTNLLDALRKINQLSNNMVVFKKEEIEKESKEINAFPDKKDEIIIQYKYKQ